jgi:probable rRNA maturation factor
MHPNRAESCPWRVGIALEVAPEEEDGERDSADLPTLLHEAICATLRAGTVPPGASLTLVVTDEAEVQALNRTFRGEDKPTDVLSFVDGEESADTDLYLGDIVIALPVAQRQALEGGHSVSAELQLLAVHGTLHLLGHDHAEPDEKARMWAAQAAILHAIAAPITAPASTHS